MQKQKYFTQNEMLNYLAELGIKKSKAWADNARFNRRGPRFVKFGGHIRTTPEWIDEWVESCVKEVSNHD